jgi:hypothetical protein
MSAIIGYVERLMDRLFALSRDQIEDQIERSRADTLERQERVVERLRQVGIDLHALDAEVRAIRREPIDGGDRGRVHRD